MPTCQPHHWVIPPATGGIPSLGVCRHCGATRAFANGEREGTGAVVPVSTPQQRERAVAASAALAASKRLHHSNNKAVVDSKACAS